jgi:hypothetical protein
MKGKVFGWAVRFVAIFVLAWGTAALADGRHPVHFKGLINDYTHATFVTAGVSKTIGPWEIRGKWSLDLHGESGTANFSAALNMELSDYAVLEGVASVDTTDSRKAHTHHITMNNAMVTEDPTDCPASPAGTPGYTSQLEVNGLADVSGNGGMAFSQVPLQVCLDGGSAVQFSNITLVFTMPNGVANAAAGHFGSQPIRGVVSKTK